MLIKHGAKMSIAVKDVILCILPKIDKIYEEEGQELVITEGVGGRHMEGSKHYKGEAIDIRNRFFPEAERPRIAQRIRIALGPDYQVVEHKTHFHIEWDKKTL